MSRRRTLWIGWVLAVLAIAGFARLGFWQYARMHEKQRILAHAGEALADRHAVPLWQAVEGKIAGATSREFTWVEGEGAIDPRTLLLDNQLRNGRPGVRVYCLLRRDDANDARTVLVDLGWLRVDARRDLPAQTCPRGPMQVRGLLARPPSSGLRMGSAMQEVGDGRWLATRIDAQSIAQAWHLAVPLPAEVLRLDPALPVGFERDLDILPNTMPPDRHLGYAVQWWALALAVLITALLLTLRKTRT